MTTAPHSALSVALHGRRIGTLSRLPGESQIFTLSDDYLNDPARPVFSLSLKTASGSIDTRVRPFHRRVPPFFSNLLPEGHLRTYLAQRAGVNPDREFPLLAVLGADLPGAVTVIPDEEATPHPEPSENPPAADESAIAPLRFSLAGVQLKFSAILEASGGLTIPAHGSGGSWIVKLPSLRFPAVSENEFVMLELARAIGIPVPRIRLVPVGEIAGLPPEAADTGNALAVERFDRGPNGARIHMEDFAQILGVFPENKYKSASYATMAKVLWTEAGEPAAYEFVRRLVFSVLIGNADMHLKNWSVLYPDQRTPVLSPAYDFVSTLPYIPNDRLALSFGDSKDITGISATQLRRFAATASLSLSPLAAIVRDTVEATTAAWSTLSAKDLLPADIRSAIDAHLSAAARASAR